MSQDNNQAQRLIETSDLLGQLWIKRSLITLISCFGGILGFVFVVLSPPKFTVDVDIHKLLRLDLFDINVNAMPGTFAPRNSGLSAAVSINNTLSANVSRVASPEAFFQQFINVFRESDAIEATIVNHSTTYAAFDGSQSEKAALLKMIKSQFRIREGRKPDVYRLSFTAANEIEGRAIASALIAGVNEKIISSTLKKLLRAKENIRAQLEDKISLLDVEIEGYKRLQRRHLIRRAKFIAARVDTMTNADNVVESVGSGVSMQQDSFNPQESNQFSNDFFMSFRLQSIASLKAELQVIQEQLESGEVIISPKLDEFIVLRQVLNQMLMNLEEAFIPSEKALLSQGFSPTRVDMKNAIFKPTYSKAVVIASSLLISFLLSMFFVLVYPNSSIMSKAKIRV